MQKKDTAQSAFLSVCILFGLPVFFAGFVLVLFGETDPESFTRDVTRIATPKCLVQIVAQ